MPSALAIMTRSTSDPRIKARLMERVPAEQDRRELALGFLDDLVDRGQALPGVRVRLVVTLPVEGLRVDRPSLPADTFLAQRGASFGERQRHVFEDLVASGFERVVVVGANVPDLPLEHLRHAFAMLAESPETAVVGPLDSGGCYLVGLNTRPAGVPDLFSNVRWETPYAMDDLTSACERAGLTVRRLETWNDVTGPSDLELLIARLGYAPDTASHTAAALRRIGLL